MCIRDSCNGTNKTCQTVTGMPVKNLCVPCAADNDCKGTTPKCFVAVSYTHLDVYKRQECSDVTSCATNHKKRADQALCQPKRCDTTFDFDCTGLSVDCFTDEDCDGYSPNNPDVKLRDCDDTDSRVHPNAQKLCDPPDGVIKDWACDGRPSAGCVPCDLDGDGFQRSEVLAGQTCPTTNYKMSGLSLIHI